MHMLQIWIIFIFAVAEYVHCGDNPSNTHGTIENSGDEDDNFEVTEPSKDDGVQPSTEVVTEDEEIDVEEIDLVASGPEEQPYPLGPPQPTHQPFIIESEQAEPLDLSIQPQPIQLQPVQPIQPQPVQPVQPQQIYPQPIQPAHPPQLIQPPLPLQPQFPQQLQPGFPIRPIALYPRPPIQPIQQPLPLQPGHPVRPIPRYPPGYQPYHPYARPPSPVQPIPPPPTHYIPPTQPVQPTPAEPTHYIPPTQPSHIPQPIQPQFQPPEPQFQQPVQYYIPPTQPTSHPPTYYIPPPTQPPAIPHPPTYYIPPPIQPPAIPHPPTYYIPPPIQPAPEGLSQPTETQEKPTETEEKERKKRFEKRCRTIGFMKKNEEGQIILMAYYDHARYYADSHKIKYKLSANLEQILCDGQLAYEHTPGTPYPSLLIENRRLMEFIVRCGDKLIKVKYHDNIWKRFEYNVPLYFEVFTKDGEGNDVKIPKEFLEVDFGYYRSFKFLFIEGTKCHKIMVENKFFWEKGDDEDFPVGFAITTKSKIVIFFEKRTAVYTKLKDCYKLLYSKPKRNSKDE